MVRQQTHLVAMDAGIPPVLTASTLTAWLTALHTAAPWGVPMKLLLWTCGLVVALLPIPAS
jgi:hypothetical protein